MASLIVYGDSFSTPVSSLTDPDKMWFRYAWPDHGVLVNRSRPSNSTQAMFLEATHDAITRTEPTKLVVALGPLSRLPIYRDGWYDREQLTENRPEDGSTATLADASARLQSLRVDELESAPSKSLIDLFHPTLLWSVLFQQVLCLGALCRDRGHDLRVLHMSHAKQDYYGRHVLTSPLQLAVSREGSYLHIEHSCSSVCHRAGIRPHDYDQYGWGGHHGPEGQRHFGLYIRQLLQQGA